MSSRLLLLLLGVLVTLVAGYFSYPCFHPLPEPEPKVVAKPVEKPRQVVVEEPDAEELDDDDFAPVEEEPAPVVVEDEPEDVISGERDADSYMPSASGIAEEIFREDDVPVDEAQSSFVPAGGSSLFTSTKNKVNSLARLLERQEGKQGNPGFSRQEFTPDRWERPEEIYKELTERMLAKLGSLEDDKIWSFLEDPANRLDLATLHMIYLAGEEGIRDVAKMELGTSLLFALSSDLDWMNGLLRSGPTKKLDKGLLNMAELYSRFSEDMGDPVARRVATTVATEFAREGWSTKHMIERYNYYYGSYREKKLNVLFNDLQYWETRLVTGCGGVGDYGWGSVRSLTWQRDNVRLPVQGYVDAAYQVEYRLRNVAGDAVFGNDYLAPIHKYTNNTTAWAHREIGGVCGALSHYGAFGALAAGLPAMPMGETGHCAYTVRVNGQWVKANSIYNDHGMHKTFWREHEWDFLILMQKLYENRFVTMASDSLVAMGDFLSARRKVKAASRCYELAVGAQPLNWPAWLRFLGYMKLKAPQDADKWLEAHDRVVDSLAVEFHLAAATLLRKYIYPTLFENVKDRRVLNKAFDSFFAQCKDFGHNRWEIGPLLNAQMTSCTTTEEKFDYMRDALRTLMANPCYAGSVLSWGLDAIAAMDGDDAMQEKFTDLIIRALSKARTSGKDMDTTWGALGESIHTAAGNHDRKTFQAIGNLAMRKCKKNFPKNKFRFRPISGKIVSQTGLLTTMTDLAAGQKKNACLHWSVLQKQGGSMPCKFGGEGAYIAVQMENEAEINGVVCIFGGDLQDDRDFVIDVSTDGQNWTNLDRLRPEAATKNMLRLDCRDQKKSGRYIRVWRDGDKYEPSIIGFYVYGKPLRNK